MFKWLTRRGGSNAEPEAAPRREASALSPRLSVADARAVSQQYFALHEQIQAAQKTRHYRRVAKLARQTYQLLPTFVAAWKREYGRWDIQSSVAVHTGSTILAVLRDREGIKLLQQTLASVEELKAWRAVGDSAENDLNLVEQIMTVVIAHPGLAQNCLRDLIPGSDGRRVATLAAWLEKAGRLRRLRKGNTYELSSLDGA